MMSPLNAPSSATNTQAASKDGNKNMLMNNFDDWMKVWVATISHQDPMNPMDAGEMATQFATFGQAIGMVEVKDQLVKANDMQANNQLLQAASQIDRVMEFQGKKIYFGPDDVSEVNFIPPANTKQCAITIMDDQSRIINIKVIDTIAQEKNIFKWDGVMKDGKMAPRGEYQIKVIPLDKDQKGIINPKTNKEYDLDTTVKGRVSGGTRIQGKPMILLGGDGGAAYPLESMMAIQSNQPFLPKANPFADLTKKVTENNTNSTQNKE